MRYYVFVTPDDQLFVKLASYIEEDNPGFFQDNAHNIQTCFKIDTEDPPSLVNMFNHLKGLKVITDLSVKELCSSIGLNFEEFAKNHLVRKPVVVKNF